MLLPRKWALSLGLLATAPSLTVAGPLDFLKGKPEPAAQAPERGNQEIADDIGQALSGARLVYKDVQIEVRSGTAVIHGQIQDAAQKATVTRIVSKVPGVTGVENNLTALDRPAARPASDVQQAAASAHDAAAAPVQHAAAHGESNRRVEQVNYAPAPAPTNQAVAQNIAEALTASGLSGYDIEVRFKSGIASLVGSVEDKEQVARAERAASSVPGVSQVLNRLTVKGRPVDIQQAAGQNPYAQQQMAPMGPPPGYRGQPAAHPAYAAHAQGHPASSGYPGHGPGQGIQPAQGMVPAPGTGMAPPPHAQIQPAGHHLYNQPNLPQYAWPTYAPYDNSAAVTYPSMYDASAWPYIGPYYPYPQVPLGWRQSTLEWDDGYWSLKFDSKTDRWWWFLNPHNWH